METFINRRGYVVSKEALSFNDIHSIKKELTVTPFIPETYKTNEVKIKVYLESEKRLYLPKYYGLQKFGPPNPNDNDDVENIHVEFKGSLRDDQIKPVNAFFEAAHDPKRRGGILNLQCAAGKTVMAIYIACTLSLKTIVIVHKEFLIEQWKERIQEFAPSARIGLIKGKVVDVLNKDIVLASLQSLSMKEYDKHVFKGFGLLIADEAHHLGAEVFSRALQKVTCLYSLALSATVKRKDGLSKVFIWHLGDIVYSNKQRAKDIINVKIINYHVDDVSYNEEITLYGSKPNLPKMINNICEYRPRVTFIVSIINDILKKEEHRRILILSDRRGHLALFMEELNTQGFTDVGYYYGGMKQDDLKISEKKQIILGTYCMISEGFDVKGLDTLILASPKSDVVQSVGRILREKPEDRKHVPLVIDVVDDFSLFPKQAKKRYSYYKSCKYDIEKEEPVKVVQSNTLIEIQDYAFL